MDEEYQIYAWHEVGLRCTFIVKHEPGLLIRGCARSRNILVWSLWSRHSTSPVPAEAVGKGLLPSFPSCADRTRHVPSP